LIERFGDRFASLDPRLRGSKLNTGRWAAWFMDQYRHPARKPPLDREVSRWYDAAGFDVVFTIPPAGGETFTEDTALFDRRHPSGALAYGASELEMLLTGGQDGGSSWSSERNGPDGDARRLLARPDRQAIGAARVRRRCSSSHSS
jgi:hypothetical protein